MPACDGFACAAHVKARTANHASASAPHRPLICHTATCLVRPTLSHQGILPGYRRLSLAKSGQVRFVSLPCTVIFGVFPASHRGVTPTEPLPSAFHVFAATWDMGALARSLPLRRAFTLSPSCGHRVSKESITEGNPSTPHAKGRPSRTCIHL
jgi:hypothetical protein